MSHLPIQHKNKTTPGRVVCRLTPPPTHVQYTQTDTIRQIDGPMVRSAPIEKDVIPIVLLVNMQLIKGT